MERRRLLLHAVLSLIAREGVAAVTHRSVAREAGVSLRATTYYFETKEDMIRQGLRHYVEASVARADAAARRFPVRKGRLAAAVEAVAEVVLEEMSDPSAFLPAELELILAISREPSYAPEYRELQTTLEQRLRALFVDLGSPRPRLHARILLAATRGMLLAHLSNPGTPLSARAVRAELRALLAALVPQAEVGAALEAEAG